MGAKKELPKGIYKRGKVYWISYTDQYGKLHRESVKSNRFAKAEQLLATRKDEIWNGDFYPRKGKYNPSFKDLKKKYLGRDEIKKNPDLLPRYTTRFNRILEHFGEDRKVKSIDSDDVREFQKWLAKQPVTKDGSRTFSENTVCKHLQLLYSSIRKVIGFEPYWKPFNGVSIKPQNAQEVSTKYIPSSHYKRLFEAADPQLQAMMAISHKLGLRLSSVLNLTWDMVDQEGDFPTLHLPAGYLKNRAALTLPLKAEIIDLIKALPEQPDNRIFQKRSHSAVSKRFVTLSRKLGYSHTYHNLRNTAATNLRKKGVATSTIMGILGWKSVTMFQHYDQQDLSDKVKALALVSDEEE